MKFLRHAFQFCLDRIQSHRFWIPGIILLLFFGALFWAKAKDPYKRVWFTLKTPAGKSKGVTVLPKPYRPMPVVIFVPSQGDTMLSSGIELRQMAELGMAAVAVDFSQGGQETFNSEFLALAEYVRRQDWAATNAIAWIGDRQGAQRLLSFCLAYPERLPQQLIFLSMEKPAWPDKVVTNWPRTLLLNCSGDEIATVEKTEGSIDWLRTEGVTVELKVLAGQQQGFEPHRTQLFRVIGEYCLSHLASPNVWETYRSIALWGEESPRLIWFWIPAVAWIALWIWAKRRERSKNEGADLPLMRWEKILRWTAVTLALAASVQTAIHLGTPQMQVTDTTIKAARKFLVAPQWMEDFDELADNPCWRNQKLKTFLTHVELSNYCVYELINWKLPKDIYNQFVLSPIIDAESDSELNWRRPLWEFFYPRIRKENDTQSAAEIVVRTLRARVTMDAKHDWPTGIESIWKNQITTPAGFERIYAATLRSVGVPARLDNGKKTEFWTGSEWKSAPRPLIETRL